MLIIPIYIDPNKEYQFLNSVIVYSDDNSTYTLANLISSFKDVFINIRKIINILKAYWIPIKFKTRV